MQPFAHALVRLLIASLFAVAGPLAFAATLSGQVLVGGTPLAGALVLGAKANCTTTDAAGHFSCNVATPWSGTLAAYAAGYTFSPPAVSFSNQSTSAGGVNFAGSRANGIAAELGLYRTTTQQVMLDYNNDSTPNVVFGFGAPGDIALAGDVNGDGITDIVLFRNGQWFADLNQDGQGDVAFGFGAPGDVPLLGDIDGDGIADLIVFRQGNWYVSTTRTGAGDRAYGFGAPTDIPVVGDFNGDGIADLAVFRNGNWYIDTNRDGIGDIAIAFGQAGDIPYAFDYDGDGRADLVRFRNGLWYINTTLDGTANYIVGYGDSQDRPLAGYFNRANTLFVRAGSPCASACTQANPYGTIFNAWQDAQDGQIIRIAKGTYAESLHFSYPGNQYAPGKFGKDNIKLLGVSKYAVTISPTAGDALELQGASGYILRGVRLQSQAANARGLVLAGGPGSYIPTFPGAQINVGVTDIVENHGPNVLLTGTANAWMRYNRINRSRANHGLSAWNHAFAWVLAGEVSLNGYTVAVGPPPPDAGKGLDVRDDAEVQARRNLIRGNLTFGVIGVNRSIVSLSFNNIDTSGYNGVIFCGPTGGDVTQSTLTSNWIASNGTADASGYNGVEYYLTCIGSHTLTGNTLISNTLNGVFVGSGTVAMTGNTFQQNRIGVTLFANDGINATTPSSADTVVTIYGNLFKANSVDGLYAERYLSTSARKIFATVGGTGAGQKNTLRDHTGGAFHAISCVQLTTQFVCPSGGNTFINNTDNIEATCPSSCVQ